MKKITVVGSFVVDLVARVEEFPKSGETILGLNLSQYAGGKGANQAVALARLGGDVEMIGMVGDDANGNNFKNIFKKEGILGKNIFTTNRALTATAMIQINKHAENKIVVIPGANFEFTLKDLRRVESAIKNSNLVITQLELTQKVEEAIINFCYQHKVPVQLNPAPAYKLSSKVLSKVTYLTPNELELSILTGLKTNTISNIKKAVQKLLSQGVKNVIATLGGNGAMIGNSQGVKHIPGFKVKVVDTVGAGDAFNGGFAFGLSKGMKIEEAVKFANAVGALAVTKNGAIPGMPRLSEVKKLMNSQK
jgi:ribokinase